MWGYIEDVYLKKMPQYGLSQYDSLSSRMLFDDLSPLTSIHFSLTEMSDVWSVSSVHAHAEGRSPPVTPNLSVISEVQEPSL